MQKKKLALAGLSLLSVAVLAACGASSSNTSSSEASQEAAASAFSNEVTHDGTAITGGQFKVAIVAASQSTGILIDELTQNTVDSAFAAYLDNSMFGYDGNRKLDGSGLATPEFDIEGKKVTITLNGKDYKWSDGEAFTIDDYIFTMKAMAAKDYTGVRFDDRYLNIEGMEDFHNGKADDVSGIKKVDDYTVELTFKEMSPSMMYAGGDVPAYVMPEHIFKDIPAKDWESSDYVRTEKVVGLGPFKIKEIVSGESITYVPNEHYFKGKPKVDSVKVDIVSPDTIVAEMKAGNYDVADMPSDQLDSFKDLSNVTLLSTRDSAYEYISFKLGKFDKEANKNVTDPNAKMADPKLRQAIAYALDTKTAGDSLYSGLYHPAKSPIISFFGDIHNPDYGFSYDPEKAKALLDEAGYKDVDGDGIREGKDGKEFKISFAARKRTEANEALIQQYIAWWKEVGLNVELYTGRTLELNSFYEEIQNDNPDIDMYAAGWSTGFDPNPSGVWSEVAEFNMSRFVSEDHNALLKDIASVDAFDDAKNKEFYDAWQKYAAEQAFVIPTFESESITAVNKRVKAYDLKYGSDSNTTWDKLELTADKGIAAE